MSTAQQSESIADKLLGAFPLGNYCLPALLEISRIVETQAVQTAAVECRESPKVLINPVWVQQHASTPEKLLMLLMHELHHVILGHTRQCPRITPLDNLVFDAVINSMLCHQFPSEAYTSLFTDYYSSDAFPHCFLRPPSDWQIGRPPSLPPALAREPNYLYAALYRGLYSQTGVSYADLRGALSTDRRCHLFPVELLLGDHRDEGESSSSSGDLRIRAPVLLDEIRRVSVEWPYRIQSVHSQLKHPEINEYTVPPSQLRHHLLNRSLVELIMNIVHGQSGRHRGDPAGSPVWVPMQIGRPDRRTVVLGSMHQPDIFPGSITDGLSAYRSSGKVHIYADVSGSMGHFRSIIYRAMLDCREYINTTLHVFSTDVCDISMDQLRRGVCPTDGGTDIHCVAEHMHTNRIDRAVLLTDGHVSAVSSQDHRVLSKCKIGVAYIGKHACDDILKPYAEHAIKIPID